MRAPKSGKGAQTGLKLDAVIGVSSSAALVGLAVVLSFAPNLLGQNIAQASSYLWLVLLVPAFRNAIELHTDLLYGHERMAARVWLLIYLGVMKATLIALLLAHTGEFGEVAIWLNGVFALLYGASALITYRRILKPSVSEN